MTPDIMEAARKYVRTGYAITPIAPGTKAPVRSKWTETRISEAEIPTCFNPANGIGLVLGLASGGLTDLDLDCHEAVRRERFAVVAGSDSDPSCKYAYEANNSGARFIQKKIEETTAAEIDKLFSDGKVKILVGCAPCQPFSLYTVKRPKDEKWKLLESFQHVIENVRPDIISMENVSELSRHSIFSSFVQRLRDMKYSVSYSVFFCPDYGVPQSRRRLVLFASRFGDIKLIKKTHSQKRWRTVQDAIGGLEAITAGGRSKSDRIHLARSMNDTNLRRIKHTGPGGSWKDWPKELQLKCHKKQSGSTYRSIYGRMKCLDSIT